MGQKTCLLKGNKASVLQLAVYKMCTRLTDERFVINKLRKLINFLQI